MEASVTLKNILIEYAETTYNITGKLFEKVSNNDLSWKPASGSNWMTTAQLLMHCARYGCGKAVQGFVSGQWDFPDNESSGDIEAHIPPAEGLPAVVSIDQALEILATDRQLTLQYLRQVREKSLLTEKITAPWGGPKMTLFQQLHMMIEHLVQHKGQLFYYLKLMGYDVNSIDLWGDY